MTIIETVNIEPSKLSTHDELSLANSLLNNFFLFILNLRLDSSQQFTNKDSDLELSNSKQLVLVRSCLSDVIYSIHCLGLWCATKTVKLYLTEFSRLLQNDATAGDLIAATTSILNCLFGRLQELIVHFKDKEDCDIALNEASSQLKSLLKNLKDFEPPIGSSWPICIIHVRKKVIAKVIALWLDEVSKSAEEFSFIKPNYIVGSSRKHRNFMAVDNFDLHHEASIRDFRFGNCNTLVVSSADEKCAGSLRCNLVVSFDSPTIFSEFSRAKANCRHDSGKYIVYLNKFFCIDIAKRISKFIEMDKNMNISNRREVLEPEETEMMKKIEADYPPYPEASKTPATIWRSLSIVNKYCSKLPSDSFTKLLPEYSIKEIESENGSNFYSEVRLPINSPVRQIIVGPEAPTRNIAIRLAAFTACKKLHQSSELDDNMLPIKKEFMKAIAPYVRSKELPRSKSQSLGSTKHRQYYQKRIAKVFSGPMVEDGMECFLYKLKMVLTCPIPDEQNRRGRRINDPSETKRNYAIISANRLPKICSFPIFTRSGEVVISVELVGDKLQPTADQVKNLMRFHKYTFSEVLRLEKYPTVFDPKDSPFTILLAPVRDIDDDKTEIDWEFVEKIAKSDRQSFTPNQEDLKNFKFNHQDYVDAVVIPWYRSTNRQQFAYYVANICTNMSPVSPFPDEGSGYATFVDYYYSKYKININNLSQPVLDVDHTSARLNLLTPRYVNRKGRALPSSTAKTLRESRESLTQKQLLIPELCAIHPIPASFWRKAVCLPCIFYRLNSLFLAEELRREVAANIKVGFVEPPEDFEWPPLNFGWSLEDVINGHLNVQEGEYQNLSRNSSSSLFTYQREWNERIKTQPLLRELFIPHGRGFLKSPDQDLSEIINSTSGWFGMVKALDELVESTMVSNPNMFKENGMELIMVNDSLEEFNLDQPSFGELLPNRDESHSSTDEVWKEINFDPTRKEIDSIGPNPSIILQALTMSNASDGINLERFETVGDSFLKYSITAYLYCVYPSMHEGKLSYLRSMEISNLNLYRLGRSKNLGEIMSATKFDPSDNWLAPGYSVVNNGTIGGDESNDAYSWQEIDKALREVPYDLLMQHSIPDKSIADCVEALIGAYLTASGSRAALLFMRWLGLRVMPDTYDLEKDLEHKRNDEIWHWLDIPPSPLVCKPPSYDPKAPKSLHRPGSEELKLAATEELESLYSMNNMHNFEEDINYSFEDKAYLVQAFTHNSFNDNHVTDCHQRLEFLGDALLDFLITRYLFEDPRCHSPGILTDLRSALVNNTFFASLAVKYKFHKYLKYNSKELAKVIEAFEKKFRFDNKDTITKGYTLLISEGESEYAEDIEIPKALGDVFESVAGAIYLDSGMSLDQVWKVYFKMMKPEIEYFSSHVPKSPIRELLESMPQNVRFSPSELAPDRKHRVTAEVFGLGRFVGVGRNKHSAKSTAAKRALRMLAYKKRKRGDGESQLQENGNHLDSTHIRETSKSII